MFRFIRIGSAIRKVAKDTLNMIFQSFSCRNMSHNLFKVDCGMAEKYLASRFREIASVRRKEKAKERGRESMRRR